jgi:uncharacterized protein YgbK (DUF1537 family)
VADTKTPEPDPPATIPVAVLDDDPTGVQTLSSVRVLLEWSGEELADVLQRHDSFHLLTNSRAYAAVEARAIVGEAATAVRQESRQALLVLRGDSTLRGHLVEEYLALVESEADPVMPPLLLAPALPSAGRITVSGVQYLERGGRRVPVHLTEYARDGTFSYTSSRLLEWAEERSSGLFAARHGLEINLDLIRRNGPEAVADVLRQAAQASRPTAIAADSETMDDVQTVARGYKLAATNGTRVVLRCGPAVAGSLEGATASTFVAMPQAERVLLVSGSYVPQSRRQLANVRNHYPSSICEVDPATLAGGSHKAIVSISRDLTTRLDSIGVAVVAVSQERPSHLTDLGAGLRVAEGLARLVGEVKTTAALMVLKGGVTSAVTLRRGLGARAADVIGPVLPGVAHWRVTEPEGRNVLIVPGNVGDDELLVQIVESALQRPR